MFDDILTKQPPKIISYPSHIELMYFKDGEGYECEQSISSEELLGSLPLFLDKSIGKEKIDLLIEKVKEIVLLDKCLHSIKNMI